MTKLYINTDIDITINIGTGFVIDDVVSMSVALTKSGSSAGLLFSGSNVAIGPSNIILKIPDVGGVTLPGVYDLKILMTDTSGNIRGLTPTPEYLRFWP